MKRTPSELYKRAACAVLSKRAAARYCSGYLDEFSEAEHQAIETCAKEFAHDADDEDRARAAFDATRPKGKHAVMFHDSADLETLRREFPEEYNAEMKAREAREPVFTRDEATGGKSLTWTGPTERAQMLETIRTLLLIIGDVAQENRMTTIYSDAVGNARDLYRKATTQQ